MRTLRLRAHAVLVLAVLCGPGAATAQADCPAAGNSATEAGWRAYRAGDVERARESFRAALARCPRHPGARTGLGYTALRSGDLEAARGAFDAVLESAPASVDALVGRGLVAWREGDLPRVKRLFERVRELDPDNADARDYLARLPEGLGDPPRRPPLVRPDTVVYPARARGDYFEVRTASGWEPFYIKGVNLGAALPGRHPSDFPDSATYARWIRDMVEMGANTVRLYTIHPPHFYRALHAHNTAHPESPLWIIHGVWTELPPEHDFDDAGWQGEFFAEMHRVVDVLHGRADVPPRSGHASGFYTADVSPWVLAYIIGREWEPYAVVGYNQLRAGQSGWNGTYLRVAGGTPADAWMARASEEIVAYEMRVYNAQRPVAYTNWPTLDPLHHPTEATAAEEVAIRRGLGEHASRPELDYDDDAVGLDANLVRPTGRFPAGFFAAYHAYPYYPDFMVFDPGYGRARSSFGPSNYFGYLRELKAHHRGMPVVIAEYGVPASLGSAHLQPQGWHHGGVTEAEMADIDARMTREIAEAGMAGGIVFAWIDEWFKKNWLVMPFEIPLDRNRLWLNRLDAEQHYGMLAMDPAYPFPGETLEARLAGWRRVEPLYTSPDGARLRAAADEAYLWLLFERGDAPAWEDLYLGFDVLRPEAGDFRWPGAVGERVPVGLEFVLRVRDGEARLLVDPPSNPYQIVPVGGGSRKPPMPPPHIEGALPGLFFGRFERRYNRPYRTLPNEDGRYDSLRVITSRRRFGRDTTEFAAFGYDRGVLPEGPLPDGLWERSEARGLLEVRIPWMLLNVTDPSQRRVLQDPAEGPLPETFGTVLVPGVRVVAAARGPDQRWRRWPDSGAVADVALFSWPTWEEPRFRARRRPVYSAMQAVFDSLEAPAAAPPSR